MSNFLNLKYRGNSGVYIVVILLLLAFVFISFMELGQTYTKSGNQFKQKKLTDNYLVTTNNDLLSEIDLMFEETSIEKGINFNYQTPIKNGRTNGLLLPNELTLPFYDTFYNFSDYDYFYELETSLNNTKLYTFLKENTCQTGDSDTKCRNLVLTSLVVKDDKVINSLLTEVELSFDTRFNHEYKGFEVIKRVSKLNAVKDYLREGGI